MRKLVYRGYILSNTDGLTDSWTLTIGQTSRTGSLFELRRQINFFEELGILPQPKIADATDTETTANKPLQTGSQKAQTASRKATDRKATDGKATEGKTKERKAGKGGAGEKAPVKAHSKKTLQPKAVSHSKDGENHPSSYYPKHQGCDPILCQDVLHLHGSLLWSYVRGNLVTSTHSTLGCNQPPSN